MGKEMYLMPNVEQVGTLLCVRHMARRLESGEVFISIFLVSEEIILIWKKKDEITKMVML